MVDYGDDKISVMDSTLDLSRGVFKPVKYKDTKVNIAPMLFFGPKQFPMKYDENAKRHITINFYQNFFDMEAKPEPIFP